MSLLTGDIFSPPPVYGNDPVFDPNVAYGGSGGALGGGSSAQIIQDSAKTMSKLGIFMSILGGINSAIGSFYAAKSMQYQMKSAASSYQFRSDMAALNARSAENDAQAVLEAGKTQIANYTMRAGQEKATTTNETAGRGVVLGVGSARDLSASQEVAKQIDMLTINSNAVREAAARRTLATNYQNESLLDRTSANNLRRSASSISPFASLTTSLLGTASTIGSQWLGGRDTRY